MTDYALLLDKIRELGMDHKWAITFVNRLKEDEEQFSVSPETRKWALERGFYPGRVELYGLTEENYRDFLPDYHYSMMHPFNNHFLKWLDKLTLKYVLNSGGCESLMPEYYAYVENERCGGRYTYLMDCPTDIPRDEDFLWNLLCRKKILAMKPNSGTSGGLGFIKLELRDGGLYENNRAIPMARFEEIRDGMRNYIVTEYCPQHHDLAAIWPESECTLRVILCKDPPADKFSEPSWSCVVSYARFGTSAGGGASNLSSGGIGVGFDYDSGVLQEQAVQYRRFTRDGEWRMRRHPDTGAVWKGLVLPHWNEVRPLIDTLCRQIASLDYLGLDIIITENGAKLCEINSLPSLDYEQIIQGPVLKREEIRSFYRSKGLDSICGTELYEAYLASQIKES